MLIHYRIERTKTGFGKEIFRKVIPDNTPVDYTPLAALIYDRLVEIGIIETTKNQETPQLGVDFNG